MSETFLDGRVDLRVGDCRFVLGQFSDHTFDSVVTDPPYALVSIVDRFGKEGRTPVKAGRTGVFQRSSRKFHGQKWDDGETAFSADFWRAVLRTLKPGGNAVAFSAGKTYHRLACAMEDAGFEIRDQLGWAYTSGFPTSHRIDTFMARRGLATPEALQGFGTALKPAWEPIVLARRPLDGVTPDTVLKYGTGGINIEDCRGEPGFDQAGAYPANLMWDGAPETLEGLGMSDRARIAKRLFFHPKADAADRVISNHPTIKPVNLMAWLVRLVTPRGGLILDPFAGSGTTGEAAWREGMRAVLIERDEMFAADIRTRLDLADKPDKRAAFVRARGDLKGAEGTDLFGDMGAAGG